MENKLIQVILKFDFKLASQIAETESKSSVKEYEPFLASSKSKAVTA
ncbi:MAG: hypothetical protein QCI00_00130 [Candidatus Thermoplasmatota archaeon]|nr:hypothetical protein [Candidatus Thermoplasmatota archaeon]